MSKDLFGDIQKGAVISDCGKYRYRLWRIWDESKPKVLFIMHNPSKADENDNDPTVTRCIGFAKSWGYGGLYIGNLMPYRATNPNDLKGLSVEVLCPLENIGHTNAMVKLCDMHILAYGNPVIKDLTPVFFDDHWHYLKLTKLGNPYHPLYLKADLKPLPFNQTTTLWHYRRRFQTGLKVKHEIMRGETMYQKQIIRTLSTKISIHGPMMLAIAIIRSYTI